MTSTRITVATQIPRNRVRLHGEILGTQIIATLIAVFGIFMAPLGWGWAGFVWVYALVWALINDRVKLLAYRILDPANSKMPAKGKLVAGAV